MERDLDEFLSEIKAIEPINFEAAKARHEEDLRLLLELVDEPQDDESNDSRMLLPLPLPLPTPPPPPPPPVTPRLRLNGPKRQPPTPDIFATPQPPKKRRASRRLDEGELMEGQQSAVAQSLTRDAARGAVAFKNRPLKIEDFRLRQRGSIEAKYMPIETLKPEQMSRLKAWFDYVRAKCLKYYLPWEKFKQADVKCMCNKAVTKSTVDSDWGPEEDTACTTCVNKGRPCLKLVFCGSEHPDGQDRVVEVLPARDAEDVFGYWNEAPIFES